MKVGIMDVKFRNGKRTEAIKKIHTVSIKEYGLDENVNIAQIVLSDNLIEDLVKNPNCGPSDYSGLPGVETSSSWRSYSEFPRRPNIAARTNRSSVMSHDERAKKNAKVRMKNEKLAIQRLAKREWRRAQQQTRRDKALSLDKWLNPENKHEQGINPGLVISSPKKGLTGKFSVFTRRGEPRSSVKIAATGKDSTELCDLAQRMSPGEICQEQRLSGGQSERLPLSTSQEGGYVTPTSKKCQAKLSELKKGSCKNKKSVLQGDKDPFEAHDSEVNSLIKMAFSSSLTKSQEESPSQNPKIAEVDQGTYNAAQRQRRNLKRICYTETLDYDDDDDEDLEEPPSRAQTEKKSHSVKRTLEKAFEEVNVMNLKMKRSIKDKIKIRRSFDDCFISSKLTESEFQQEAIENPITTATSTVISAIRQSQSTFTHGQQQLFMEKLVASATQPGKNFNLHSLYLSNQNADKVTQPEVTAQPNTSVASIPVQAHMGKSELKLLPLMSAASGGKSFPLSSMCLGTQPLLASDLNNSATVHCQQNLLQSGHPPYTNNHDFGSTSTVSLLSPPATYPSVQQSCVSISHGSSAPKNQTAVLSTFTPHVSPDEKHLVILKPFQRPVQAVNPNPTSELRIQDTISVPTSLLSQTLSSNTTIVSNTVQAHLISQSTQSLSTKRPSKKPGSNLKLNYPQSSGNKSQMPDKSGVEHKKRTRCRRQMDTKIKIVSSKKISQPLPQFNETTSPSGFGPSPAVISTSDLKRQCHLQSIFVPTSSRDQHLPEARITSLATPVLSSINPTVISSSKQSLFLHNLGSNPSLEVHQRKAEVVTSDLQFSQQQKSVVIGMKNDSGQLKDLIRNPSITSQETPPVSLPPFASTYHLVPQPSTMQNLRRCLSSLQECLPQPFPSQNFGAHFISSRNPKSPGTSLYNLTTQPVSSHITTDHASSQKFQPVSSQMEPAQVPSTLPVAGRPAQVPSALPVAGRPAQVPSTLPVAGRPAQVPSTLPVAGRPAQIPSTLPVAGRPAQVPSTLPVAGRPAQVPSTLPVAGRPAQVPSTLSVAGRPAQVSSTLPVAGRPAQAQDSTLDTLLSSQHKPIIKKALNEEVCISSLCDDAGRPQQVYQTKKQTFSQNKTSGNADLTNTLLNANQIMPVDEKNPCNLTSEAQVLNNKLIQKTSGPKTQKNTLKYSRLRIKADPCVTKSRVKNKKSVTESTAEMLSVQQKVNENVAAILQKMSHQSVPIERIRLVESKKPNRKTSKVLAKDTALCISKKEKKLSDEVRTVSEAVCVSPGLQQVSRRKMFVPGRSMPVIPAPLNTLNAHVKNVSTSLNSLASFTHHYQVAQMKQQKRPLRAGNIHMYSNKSETSAMSLTDQRFSGVSNLSRSLLNQTNQSMAPAPEFRTDNNQDSQMSPVSCIASLESSSESQQRCIQSPENHNRSLQVISSVKTSNHAEFQKCVGLLDSQTHGNGSNPSSLSSNILSSTVSFSNNPQTKGIPNQFSVRPQQKTGDLNNQSTQYTKFKDFHSQPVLSLPQNLGVSGLVSTISPAERFISTAPTTAAQLRPLTVQTSVSSQLSDKDILSYSPHTTPLRQSNTNILSTQSPVKGTPSHSLRKSSLSQSNVISLSTQLPDKGIISHSLSKAPLKQSGTTFLFPQSPVKGIQTPASQDLTNLTLVSSNSPAKGVVIQTLTTVPQRSAYHVTTQSPGKEIPSHSLIASPQKLRTSTNLTMQSPARVTPSHLLPAAQQRLMSDSVKSFNQSPTKGFPSHSFSTAQQRFSDSTNLSPQSSSGGIICHSSVTSPQRLSGSTIFSIQSPAREVQSHLLSTTQQKLSGSACILSTQSPAREVPGHSLSTTQQRLSGSEHVLLTQSPAKGLHPWSPTRPLNLITGLVRPSPRKSVKEDQAVNTSAFLSNSLVPNSASCSPGSHKRVRTISDNLVRMTMDSVKPPESSFTFLKVCVDLNHNDNENGGDSELGNEAIVVTEHGNDKNAKKGSFLHVTPKERALNFEPQTYYRETSSLPHESPKRTTTLEVHNDDVQPLFSSPSHVSGIAYSQKYSHFVASPEVGKRLLNQKTLYRTPRISRGLEESLEKDQSPNIGPNIGADESRQLSLIVPNLETYGSSERFTQNQGNVLVSKIIRWPVSGDNSREVVEQSEISGLSFGPSGPEVLLLCRSSPENLSKVPSVEQPELQVSTSLTDCPTTAINSTHNNRLSELTHLNSSLFAASSDELTPRSKNSVADFTKHGRDKTVQPPVAIVKPSLPSIKTSQSLQTVNKQPSKPVSSAYDQLFIWHTDAHVNSDPHLGEMGMDFNVLMGENCVFPAQNIYTVTVSLPETEKPATPTCFLRNSTEVGVKQEQESPVVRINQKELVDLSVSDNDAESSSEMIDDSDEVADFQTDLCNGVAMVCVFPSGVDDAASRNEPGFDYCPRTEFSVSAGPQGEKTGERYQSQGYGKDTQRPDLALCSELDSSEALDLSLPDRTISTASFLLNTQVAAEQLEPKRFLSDGSSLHETHIPSNTHFNNKAYCEVSKVSSTPGNVVDSNGADDTFLNQKLKAAKVKLELAVSRSPFIETPDDVTPDSSQPFVPATSENSSTLFEPSEKLNSLTSTSKLLPPASNPPLVQGAVRHLLASLADWTNAEVMDWLRKHQLDKICPNFSSLDGRGLQRLAVQYQHDSNFFYSHVKQTLGLTIFQTMVVCHSMKTLLAADTVDDAKSRIQH